MPNRIQNPDKIKIEEKDSHQVITVEDAYENGADVIYVMRNEDSRIIMLVADMNSQQTDELTNRICF